MKTNCSQVYSAQCAVRIFWAVAHLLSCCKPIQNILRDGDLCKLLWIYQMNLMHLMLLFNWCLFNLSLGSPLLLLAQLFGWKQITPKFTLHICWAVASYEQTKPIQNILVDGDFCKILLINQMNHLWMDVAPWCFKWVGGWIGWCLGGWGIEHLMLLFNCRLFKIFNCVWNLNITSIWSSPPCMVIKIVPSETIPCPEI